MCATPSRGPDVQLTFRDYIDHHSKVQSTYDLTANTHSKMLEGVRRKRLLHELRKVRG